MELSNCAHGATLDPLVGSAQDFNKFYAGLVGTRSHMFMLVLNNLRNDIGLGEVKGYAILYDIQTTKQTDICVKLTADRCSPVIVSDR